MDTTAFKQRMQNLKSYRENNPGKGYWDWKVDAFQNGGKENPWPNLTLEERQKYYKDINPALGFGVTDFLGAALTRSGLAKRTVAPSEDENRWKAYLGLPYDEQYAPTSNIRFNGDEKYPNRQYQGLSREAKEEIRKSIIPKARYITENVPENKWIQVTDETPRDIVRNDVVYHNRQNHLGDLGKFGIRENNNSGIYEVGDKYDFPWYVPIPDRASGTELMIRDTVWSDKADPSKYIEYKIPRKADGGTTENKELPVRGTTGTNSYGDKTHYVATSLDNNTLNLNLPDVVITPSNNLSLAGSISKAADDIVKAGVDAATYVTPLGDVLAMKDAYDAVKNKDWFGVGISTAAMLPFVPTVNKRLVSDAIDKMAVKARKEARMATRLNNETYELVQRLTDDPSYMRRAQEVKDKYGDDYTKIYADLINAYNTNPQLLPKAKATEFTNNARAKMATTTESTARHKAGGEFPKLGEYEYQFDSTRGVPYGVSVHENNHLTDFLSNKTPDAGGNSNMYYYMRSVLKPYSDNLSKYYGNPSEQKAYMNQLREFMYANKMIDTRDQHVSKELIKEALDKLPKGMKSVKDASKSWKSMRSYTKWFNTIPLLGAGLVGANNYFNDTKE